MYGVDTIIGPLINQGESTNTGFLNGILQGALYIDSMSVMQIPSTVLYSRMCVCLFHSGHNPHMITWLVQSVRKRIKLASLNNGD